MRLALLSSRPLANLLTILAAFFLSSLLIGSTSAVPLWGSSGLESRQDSAPNAIEYLDARSSSSPPLVKRSNCQPNPDGAYDNCDGQVPGVDEALQRIQARGIVGRLPAVFYTAFPTDLPTARRWANCFFPGEPESPAEADYRYAIWKRLADNRWIGSESFWIREAQPDDVSDADNDFYADMFLKHIAQAYAEAAQGDVYLVVDDAIAQDNRGWNTNQAWGGWEWPALTRNSNVERIFRVNPNTADDPREIWTRADGPQGNDPRGVRAPTPQTPRTT